MTPSASKLAASAFLSSTQSAARALSLYAKEMRLEKRNKMVLSLDVRHKITKRFSSSSSNSVDASKGSSRGRSAVGLLPTYLSDARAVEKYHPENCPNGALQLSVAENQMLEDLLVPAYSKFSVGRNDSEAHSPFYADQIYYQPTQGRPGLRRSMAHFLRKMLKLPSSAVLCEDNLIMGAGCNAVLENLVFCLAEHGDPVLVPTPYYAAFEFDLVARAGLQIIPVETELNFNVHGGAAAESPEYSVSALVEKAYFPTPASLDAAYAASLEQTGRKPRILLLSHPNNPLGICYPKEVLSDCISWARENEVHLISDEIYAGSVYKPSNFHSALSIAADNPNGAKDMLGIGPYVHFVYALSKDFASSGLRVGVAYTENDSIVLPLQKLNDLCQISSQTQLLVENMLSGDWAMSFLEENQSRIRNRSNLLTGTLDELDIPYLEPDSGLFVWMDFRQFLPELDENVSQEAQKGPRERALYLELMHEFGLLFTPGLSMRNLEPGFFRCVFTAASDGEFKLALERLKTFVQSKRDNQ